MSNKVLATVGNRKFTENEIEELIKKCPQDRKAFYDSENGRKQLLEQLIQFELMNKLGKEMKIDETDEYKLSLQQMESDLLTQLTVNKVLADVTITDVEAKKYYDENKEEFKQPETVSAKHILVDNEETAKEVKEKIDSNEITFEEAATKYSTCPSKAQGGDLGSFGRGMMVPEFEEAAFNLELNKVSEPVKTQFGYHIIKVESKNEAKTSEFDSIKDQIVNRLIQEAQQNKMMELLKELEGKYEVKRA